MADAKDYLELWRERYSFPNYISDNFRLSEDGTIVLDNEEEWSAAQKILLQSSAVGTSKNFYLDPKPLFNKLGEIYTNIINSSFTSARTDSIKMNRNNMDYTNGSGLLVDQTPVYPFFCFLYNTPEDVTSKEVYNDWYNENVVTDIITAISNNNIDTSIVPNKITIDSKLLKDKHFPSFTKVEAATLENYLNYYKKWYNKSDYKEIFNNLFNTSSDNPEIFWNKHWYEIKAINSETLAQQTFYLPNEKFVEQFRLFKKKMLDKARGLQLLMPQYHRRVEVEDLDENFWVISVILDAVVNALWGPYGLIDVVRQLIAKVTQIEDFLGLSNLTGIELLYNGKDELYFDMYSRFLLSGLELKLKTQSGERIIKNIFKSHTEYVNRNSTTDVYKTRKELFEAIQFNEITPSESDYESTGLYDSDLICSDDDILDIGGEKSYVSLSTVIDAINNAIVKDKVSFGSVNYDISPAYKEFFSKLDITPDGTLSPTDYEMIATDNQSVSTGATLTPEQIERFNKYALAKKYLEDLVNGINPAEGKGPLSNDQKELLNNLKITSLEDINKYFTSKKVLVDTSIDTIDTDENGAIDTTEYKNYANAQIKQIKDFFNNLIQTFGISSPLGNTIENIEDIGDNKTIVISTAIGDSEYDTGNKGLKNTLATLQELSEYLNRYYIVKETTKEYLDVSIEDKSNGASVTITKKTGIPNNIQDSHYVITINEFDDIGVLPTEDIYTYSLYGATILAKKVSTDETNEINKWFKENTIIGNTFFDVVDRENTSSSGPVNLQDAIEISKSLLPKYNNGEYFAKIKDLMTLIDNDDASNETTACVNALAQLANINKNHKNPFPTGVVNESVKTAIKNYFFVKKYDGSSESVKVVSEICCPNLYMLIEIAKMAQPIRDREGYKITDTHRQDLINTITQTNYQLHDNILVFLYDEDYYKIQETGLYVSVTDGFYTTNQPVIRYNLNKKQDTTHFLFVPRADLIGGEIIELRLTEKGVNKEILDLSRLTKNGFETMKTTKSRLFLSLHNSFADIPAQYNHRTTLFFKDTVPEDIDNLGQDGNPFKNIDSWFCNGIECQYFKPTIKKVNEDTELSTQQTKLVDLKIKASMICKAENINDNSFIFEEGPTESKLNNETFYSFARKMAFGAAQRYNLVFYSSPATHDGDMFIHSPSQLLLSPSLRGDENIQPPYWVSDSEYAKRIYAYDVMDDAGETCKLADITSMLYKNSLTKEKTPLVIDAIWGMRDVDNYIKPKKIKYIIIEREPGSRNNTYGPTSIGFSHSSGYLHSGNGLTSLGEYNHYNKCLQIQWYTSKGIPISNRTCNFPPVNAKYGVINLEQLEKEEGASALQFAQTFMIRFYSSDTSDITTSETQGEFITKINNKSIYRRPIFKMAYFLGEDMTETEFINNKNYSNNKK